MIWAGPLGGQARHREPVASGLTAGEQGRPGRLGTRIALLGATGDRRRTGAPLLGRVRLRLRTQRTWQQRVSAIGGIRRLGDRSDCCLGGGFGPSLPRGRPRGLSGVATGVASGAKMEATGGRSTPRWLEASYRRIEPATEALSDDTWPSIGMRTTASQRRRTAGPRP
jgi:hypothetical protein